MKLRFLLTTRSGLLLALLVSGCSNNNLNGTRGNTSVTGRVSQSGESVVFVGQEEAQLAHLPIGAVRMRSTYLPKPGTVIYEEGRDFAVDRGRGTVRRLPESRVPDFRTNVLFGQVEFDHNRFPGFGNGGFFAFIDYEFQGSATWPKQASQAHLLPRTEARLKSGEPLRIVAYGDSITAGGDATEPYLIFWQRWADYLQRKYGRSHIEAINGATGGDSTVQGLSRLQVKVIDQKPHLVLIGFGMNDHNVGGVPIPQFQENLRQMIQAIRDKTGAEVLLFSAFPPNPRWKFGSHRMQEYAAATEDIARKLNCAYADVYNNWQAIATRKKPEDLLGNNINHPNDFGHWIYFRVLQDTGL